MSPKFCQRQALLFYVESEPRGTSTVPNVESLVFTLWKYAICPDRCLNPEPSDCRTCVLTMRPLHYLFFSQFSLKMSVARRRSVMGSRVMVYAFRDYCDSWVCCVDRVPASRCRCGHVWCLASDSQKWLCAAQLWCEICGVGRLHGICKSWLMAAAIDPLPVPSGHYRRCQPVGTDDMRGCLCHLLWSRRSGFMTFIRER